MSGRVSDNCLYLSSSVLEREKSINMVGDILLKPLGVADLDLRNQENRPMPERVPNKCPDLYFQV